MAYCVSALPYHPQMMQSDLRPLPTASKAKIALERHPNTDQAFANTAAGALGCRVVERYWPAWSPGDTLTTLVRWTLIVEDRREHLGRPLRREAAALRSDWADCERQLGVPLAHLINNARLHRLPLPKLISAADAHSPSPGPV